MEIKYVNNGFSFNPKMILVFLITLLVSIVGGIYIPMIAVSAGMWVVDFLGVFAYCALIIGTINLLTKLLKVPSNKTVRIMYLIIGILAAYFYLTNYVLQFELWLYDTDLFELVFRGYGDGPLFYPRVALEYALDIPLAIEEIAYMVDFCITYGGGEGILIVISWVVTAIGIPLAVTFIPSAAFKPFDQEKQDWYKRVFHKSYSPNAKSNAKVLKQAILDGDFSYFEEAETDSISSNRVDVYLFLDKDGETTDIIEVVSTTRDHRNRVNKTTIVDPVHITDSKRKTHFASNSIF